MRMRNKTRSLKAVRCGIPMLALFLTLGCVPTAKHSVAAPSPPPAAVQPVVESPVEPAVAALHVERDNGVFAITQSLAITADMQADYEAAVHMLQEAKYEPGIALLLKLTERAPAL